MFFSIDAADTHVSHVSESMSIGNPFDAVPQCLAGSKVCMDPLCWKTSGLGYFWRGAFVDGGL